MPALMIVVLIALVCFTAGSLLWVVGMMMRKQARDKRALDIVMLNVLLPKDLKPEEREEGVGQDIKERIAVAEQWLSTLVKLPQSMWDKWLYGRPVIVCEVVALADGTIQFFVGTERRYADHLEKQIYSFYPEAEVGINREFTIFNPHDTVRIGNLSLAESAHLPIATYQELEADPMQAITGALAKLASGDAAVVQLLLRTASKRVQKRARTAAKRTIAGKQEDVRSGFLRSTASSLGKSEGQREKEENRGSQLTQREQERIELVERKASQQQFMVNLRIAVATRQPEDAERVFNAVTGAFAQFDIPDLNALRLKTPRNQEQAVRDLIWKVPDRQGSVLSTTEVASLFHLPLPTTATPNIKWRGAKTAPVPAGLSSEGVMLGENVYRGVSQPVYLQSDDRRRHMYLIGQTGTGKTTMFLNMIVQDIVAGKGVGVVDPHGDLIEDILLHIPSERMEDVILFDPKDKDRPLGFNILEAKDPAQKDLVVNEVVQILQKLAARLNPESVGPMFEHYLRNSLLALVEDENATLLDVPRMFVDEQFRDRIVALATDPTVRQFWEKEFKASQKGQMSADMLSYVISKLGRFIGNALVRNMLGQPKSSFDVRSVMDEKKILLCNLSKGSLGDINADLLGFVLVSKIQIAALGRANVSEEQRPDFYFYLDEFQNFTTDSISVILSEARKYHLNLNLTHQFIQQLDDDIREAVFGNVGTIVSYRVGIEDAEFMGQQFAPVFTDYDVVNLERFTAVTRLLNNGTPTRPFSMRISQPPEGGNADRREQIREMSRQKYGRDRVMIEEDILKRFQLDKNDRQTRGGATGDYLSESLFDVS